MESVLKSARMTSTAPGTVVVSCSANVCEKVKTGRKMKAAQNKATREGMETPPNQAATWKAASRVEVAHTKTLMSATLR
jgi:hypothetical protein